MTRKQEWTLTALSMALMMMVGAAWYMAWVVPNDRRMEATFECMAGDPQRYQLCAEQVETSDEVAERSGRPRRVRSRERADAYPQ